jgi:acyl carrier protein
MNPGVLDLSRGNCGAQMIRNLALVMVGTGTVCVFLSSGCGTKPANQGIVDRVRSEVAKILNTDPGRIDVTKPLKEYGADDLDVVEIIIAVEEAFDISIPDDAVFEDGEHVGKLTVTKLADAVRSHLKSK